MRTFWRRFVPEPLPTRYRERLRAAIGACLGIAVTALISSLWAGQGSALPLLIAAMGSSAILLFAFPASPLAQPWSIIGGNLVSALVGVTTARFVHDPVLAASLAVAAALGAMSLLRCVHPPSGSVALTAVLGGPAIWSAGYDFVLMPVALNSVILTLIAIAYNHGTGVSYPHEPHPHIPSKLGDRLHLTMDDLDQALTDYGEAIDISRHDLQVLFEALLARAEQRGKIQDGD